MNDKREDILESILKSNTVMKGKNFNDKSTLSLLRDYLKKSKELDQMASLFRKYVNSGRVDFIDTRMRADTALESKVYKEYTETSCLEAEAATTRVEFVKKMALLCLVFLIISIIACIFFCGCSGVKIVKMRKKNNFFGHNNGEDRLIIDHHWQEESEEEEPRYMCVRDPNLKDLGNAKNYQTY